MIDWIERRRQRGSGSGALLLDAYGGAYNRPAAEATAFVTATCCSRSSTALLQRLRRRVRERLDQRRLARAAAVRVQPGLPRTESPAACRLGQRAYYAGTRRGCDDQETGRTDGFARFRQAIPPAPLGGGCSGMPSAGRFGGARALRQGTGSPRRRAPAGSGPGSARTAGRHQDSCPDAGCGDDRAVAEGQMEALALGTRNSRAAHPPRSRAPPARRPGPKVS